MRRWVATSLMVAGLSLSLSGCTSSSTAAPITAAEAPVARAPHEEELPKMLVGLDIDPTQAKQILALRDRLKGQLVGVKDAAVEVALSLAAASKRCQGDTTWIGMAADQAVRAGENARDPILDGINELHAILTPAQRRALADRLLADEDDDGEDRRERSGKRTRDGVQSLGADLDLSFGQIAQIVVRALRLRDAYLDELEPWRERYEHAVEAFPDDDFDVRRQAVAQVPLVKITADTVREGFRLLITLLEPDQCRALGKTIDEALERAEQRQAEESEEAAAEAAEPK
ncbi:MAG: hypothetical protein R3B72_35060 [Polyangiaceae bacterium]